MATPSSVQTATTHNWLGSSSDNILKPTIDETDYQAFGEEDITGLMSMHGFKNPVASLQYRHFEDDRLHTAVRATGTTAGADTNVTYTVDASYTMTSFPATFDPYLLASFDATAPAANGTTTLHPVRAGDGLLFFDGSRGHVISVTTTTFVVSPEIEGASLPTVVNTDSIVIMGITQGEGATIPGGVNLRENVYSNVLEIIADSAEATGSAMGEKTWVKMNGKDGRSGYCWFYKQQDKTLRRFKNFREMKLVAGEAVTSTTNLATTNATLLKTEGLYTFAASYNGNTNYNIAAGLSKADFSNLITDKLDANEGADENCLMAAIRVRSSIDNFVSQEMQAGAVQYNSFSGGKDQAVNFGYNGFTHLGYTFQLKTYKLLNNPTLLGDNNSFKNSAIVLPLDKKAYSIGESRSKKNVNAFRMNYMSGDTGSRELEEFMTGGTGGVYTNTTDSQQMNLRSHFGFEGFGANRFNVLQGV